MKIMIVYWSGTGNTEAMANAVYAGAKEAGAEVELHNVSQAGDVSDCDVLLLGCPAMGSPKSLNRSLRQSKVRFPAEKSGCSARMNGRTANGCAHGSREWKRPAAS